VPDLQLSGYFIGCDYQAYNTNKPTSVGESQKLSAATIKPTSVGESTILTSQRRSANLKNYQADDVTSQDS